jgi:hypothetical protein
MVVASPTSSLSPTNPYQPDKPFQSTNDHNIIISQNGSSSNMLVMQTAITEPSSGNNIHHYNKKI